MNQRRPIKRQARGVTNDDNLEQSLAGVTLDLKRLRKDPKHTIKGGWRRLNFRVNPKI